jgi:hypothetical protein
MIALVALFAICATSKAPNYYYKKSDIHTDEYGLHRYIETKKSINDICAILKETGLFEEKDNKYYLHNIILKNDTIKELVFDIRPSASDSKVNYIRFEKARLSRNLASKNIKKQLMNLEKQIEKQVFKNVK